MKTIGFIGIGVMGESMADNLMQAGFQVQVYTRTKSKAETIIGKGAVWKESVKEVTEGADAVITIIGYPKDVEEVYLGEDGILAYAKEGTYVIDMTTSKPSLAKEIYQAAKNKGIFALDAPVSGGDIGAKNGTLAIMAGGEEKDFLACRSIFEAMGENIVYQGGPGSGQHTKMCNQIAIASGMIGVCESLVYAKRAGLDPENVLKSISTGAAGSWSLSNLGPRMLKEDFEPGFYVKHFVKDMDIALSEIQHMDVEMPGLQLVRSLYGELLDRNEDNSGTQALYKLWNY
ncbi:NAD-binding protein [Bacillus lacus]|uniref:NAD-binding protein n=1 Tax=Metabacillus lacus TaxID=1983721 RepID=A0A7X2LX70_9BACI|nr:NAD(P)-dependent oxidoreductase [Metabacillus lacus]MRX72245.1 NAD-binding protein [Metabacillus lacus]